MGCFHSKKQEEFDLAEAANAVAARQFYRRASFGRTVG